MRKLGSLAVSFLLFLSVGSLAIAPDGILGKALGQDQPDQPKFYALRVISEKDVLNAKDALGAPDGRFAEILPGGQLVLLMEKELYIFPTGAPDDGAWLAYSGVVVAKGETPAVLEGWIPVRDLQGNKRYDWIPIGMLAVSDHGWPEGVVRTDKIRITNTGTESLYVDAIIGLGQEVARKSAPI